MFKLLQFALLNIYLKHVQSISIYTGVITGLKDEQEKRNKIRRLEQR